MNGMMTEYSFYYEYFYLLMLEGPMKGKQSSDLATAMSNGSTYVNVHTEQHPNCEIRGQIMAEK